MSVGFKLYREVRDFAPGDWSPSELVVAWVIADDARDDTRSSWIPLELLCQRTRLAPSTVRACLAKLAARGYEFRVIHGFGKDGRPVFATKGHAVDYRVPDMTKGAVRLAPLLDESRYEASAFTDSKALGNEPKALANGPKGATRLAPHTSVPSITTSTEEPDVTYSKVEVPAIAASSQPSLNGHGETAAARPVPPLPPIYLQTRAALDRARTEQ